LRQTAINYKLIKKVKDEKFDEEHLHLYSLLVQLGVRDCQVAVIDDEKRIVLLEDYVFGEMSSHEELIDQLRGLFESHQLLMAGFWKKVTLSIKNNKMVQVPEALFIEDAAAEYLKFNASIDLTKEDVLFCQNKLTDAITVFAVQKELHQLVREVYLNTTVNIIHQSAALIEGLLDYKKELTGTPLYIYVDRFKLHILFVQEGKLIYYNQFVIKQFSDYVKYIMQVMKGLQIDQATSQVVLWGYIGKNSPHYQEFYKYIKNVSFAGRPSHIKFGYMFDEVQEHHFFDLFSMNLL
jgi:hypothetical protein